MPMKRLVGTLILLFCMQALYGAGTNRIFVTNEQSNSITVIDGKTLKVETSVAIGDRPRGIGLSPDGKHFMVSTISEEHLRAPITAARHQGAGTYHCQEYRGRRKTTCGHLHQ